MAEFLDLVDERVVVYDGAFGTYCRTRTSTADDFGGPSLEGCNEHPRASPGPTSSPAARRVLRGRASTSSRPTPSAPSPSRSASTASPSGPTSSTWPAARIAREVADGFATPTAPVRRRLDRARAPSSPSLGQIRFAELRDAYEVQARGLLEGGVDLLLIETQFDLLGVKAAIIGARRAMAAVGREVPSRCRSRWSPPAACCSAPRSAPRSPPSTPLRPDVIGLNCATGPAEMSEHLRHLVASTPACRSRACPTPACRRWSTARCTTTSRPSSSPSTTRRFVTELGVRSSAAAAAPRPSTSRRSSTPCAGPRRRPAARPSTSRRPRRSTQPRAVRPGRVVPHRSASAPTPTARRSSARRCSTATGTPCVADGQATRSRKAPTSSTSASTTSAATAPLDMDEIASRFATQATVPLVLDSTEPAGDRGRPPADRRPGHPQLGQPRGRRRPGHPPRPRLHAGHASTAPRSSACSSTRRARPATSSGSCGSPTASTTSPSSATASSPATSSSTRSPSRSSTGDEDLPPRRHRHHRGHPPHQGRAARASTRPSACRTCRFGLKPAARHVLNSVFLHECVRGRPRLRHRARGPDHAAEQIPDEQREVCLDLIYDRRDPATATTRCQSCSTCSRTSTRPSGREGGPLAAGRSSERLKHRIIDGDRDGLEADLDEAHGRRASPPLAIINDVLLAGMKVVGELFGSRRDAAAVRAPVGRDDEGRGRLPRAAHGEGRRRPARAASCSPP